MITLDFTKYSSVLIKDNQIIYSSDKSGLRPLLDCIKKYQSQFQNCTLYDKVVGLAAARLIVYSKMISLVITQVSSKSAQELLVKNNIKIKTQNIVENILTKDKSFICPMELKAQIIDDNNLFFLQIKNKLNL